MNAPIADVRVATGVQAPGVIASLLPLWDVDAEAESLTALHHSGVPQAATRALHEWFVGVFNGAVGNVGNLDVAAVEADFRALAKKRGVPAAVVDALVRHHRARLGL